VTLYANSRLRRIVREIQGKSGDEKKYYFSCVVVASTVEYSRSKPVNSIVSYSIKVQTYTKSRIMVRQRREDVHPGNNAKLHHQLFGV
jgi:hypothetical protein